MGCWRYACSADSTKRTSVSDFSVPYPFEAPIVTWCGVVAESKRHRNRQPLAQVKTDSRLRTGPEGMLWRLTIIYPLSHCRSILLRSASWWQPCDDNMHGLSSSQSAVAIHVILYMGNTECRVQLDAFVSWTCRTGELRRAFTFQAFVLWPLIGHKVAGCSMSLPLREMYGVVRSEEADTWWTTRSQGKWSESRWEIC